MKLLRAFSLVSAMAFFSATPVFADKESGTFDVYWVDAEGGGGTLMVTPVGESSLVDAGMPGGRDPGCIHELAAEVVGLKQIDHLITTHFYLDHFGGAANANRQCVGQRHSRHQSGWQPERRTVPDHDQTVQGNAREGRCPMPGRHGTTHWRNRE